MRRTTDWLSSVAVAAFAGWIVLAATAQTHADVTPEAVRSAIRRGVEYLKSAQDRRSGGWTEYASQPGGVTALCTLALLNAGVEVDDPSVRRALNYLRRLGNPASTYSTALQTMVFATASPVKDRMLIRQNAAWLESAQVQHGRGSGGWTYKAMMGGGSPDNSNSQFALLGLYAAQRSGVEIQPETWERAAAYWRKHQLPDGSWGYRGETGTGSMTCAGLASLMISTRSLAQGDASVVNGVVNCCLAGQPDPAQRRGMRWLGRHFSVTRNPSANPRHSQTWLFYYLYGVERVGRLSGRRFIGQHDWYREGAEMFVERQDRLTGAWQGAPPLPRPDIGTALALLFLSKGRRPVLMSKLRYDEGADWNRHRNDARNLTHYVERQWQRDLTWQIVNLEAASLSDLLQSPVVYISGKDGFQLSNADKDLLRDYVNQGGFLFVEACCKGSAFDKQFRKTMEELFPDSPLKLLPPEHPIWYAEQRIDSKFMRPLYGLDTCCRTGVVYSPEDLGCFWELAWSDDLPYPRNVKDEVQNVLAIGANVLAYATGRELRDKLDVPQVLESDEDGAELDRGALQIAKLQHTGGSDDAPAALANLLRLVRDKVELPVNLQRRLLLATDPDLSDFPVLFVHGRTDFRLSDEEREALKQFVEHGGIIFGDAICASKPFATAFRREMQAVFPDKTMARIPAQHPMFTPEYRGFDLAEVELRRSAVRSDQEPLAARVEQVTPVLGGIEFDGQYGVIFSPYDISCAMENHTSMDCTGYTRQDAARLAINVILYALHE